MKTETLPIKTDGGHSTHWSVKEAKGLAIHFCQEWKRKQVSRAAPRARVNPRAMETDPGKLISNLTWSQRKTYHLKVIPTKYKQNYMY